MKRKIILLPLLFGLFALTIFGQGRERMPDDDNPQVQELRKEFFNTELQFSEKESADFWPIYDKFKGELKAVKTSQRKPKLELMTDAEAEQFLNDHFVKEEKVIGLRKQLVADLRGKIGVRKIAMISQTERKFKRELFKELRAKRMEERGGKRRF